MDCPGSSGHLSGLCLFIDSLVVRSRDGSRLVLAGLALGLTVLASAGSLGVLLPALPAVGVLAAVRRVQALSFWIGLFIGVGGALATGWVLSRPYLAALSGPLHLACWCAVGFGAAALLAALLARPRARAWVRRACAFNVRFRWFRGQEGALPSLGAVAQWLALVLPVAALVGLAERPYFQVVRGQADPAVIRAVAALQRLERLPVDGLRQYSESSLYWVGLVPRGARGAAGLRGGGGARAADGRSGARGPFCCVLGCRVVGAAAAGGLLGGRGRAMGPVGGALAAARVAAAGARGPAGACAPRGMDVVVARVAGSAARRVAYRCRAGRRLLCPGAGGPVAGDDAEPGAFRRALSGSLFIGRGEARQPGADAGRGSFRRLQRFPCGDRLAVRCDRAVGERPVRVFFHGGHVRARRPGVVRAAGRLGPCGVAVGAGAGGALGPARWAAAGAARALRFVRDRGRGRAAAGGLAADVRRR